MVPRLHVSKHTSLLADATAAAVAAGVIGVGSGHHASPRGVLDVSLTRSALFSCGSDGSVKVLFRSRAPYSSIGRASDILGVSSSVWL